jgi:hypothetical protein
VCSLLEATEEVDMYLRLPASDILPRFKLTGRQASNPIQFRPQLGNTKFHAGVTWVVGPAAPARQLPSRFDQINVSVGNLGFLVSQC